MHVLILKSHNIFRIRYFLNQHACLRPVWIVPIVENGKIKDFSLHSFWARGIWSVTRPWQALKLLSSRALSDPGPHGVPVDLSDGSFLLLWGCKSGSGERGAPFPTTTPDTPPRRGHGRVALFWVIGYFLYSDSIFRHTDHLLWSQGGCWDRFAPFCSICG